MGGVSRMKMGNVENEKVEYGGGTRKRQHGQEKKGKGLKKRRYTKNGGGYNRKENEKIRDHQ